MRRLDKVCLAIGCLIATFAYAAAPVGQADYVAGLNALQNKQWKDARSAFDKAVTADDDNAIYHLARGIAAAVLGDVEPAREDFDRARRLAPEDADATQWLNLAQLQPRATPEQVSRQHSQAEAATLEFVDNEMRKHPEFARATIAQATAAAVIGKPVDGAAMHELDVLLQANPWNMDALFDHARILKSQGDFADARVELTRVLTAKTDFGNGYATRAPVEAAIGNFARGRADLDRARRYGADAELVSQMEKEFAGFKEDSGGKSPQELWAALEQSAQGGASWDQLVPQAIELGKLMNARRIRWDELYQDRLRGLEDGTRQAPRNVDRLLALGEFLYRESDALAEPVSPKGELRSYRYAGAGAQDREIYYADHVFDQVLQVDPKNVNALTWKAAIRLEHDNWPQGEALVQQALAIRPDVPQLLELFSRVLDSSASVKAYNAADLRTPQSWWTYGINVNVLWTRQPSQADYDRADQNDQLANRMWAESEQSLTAAVQSEAGTSDGAYYNGLLLARHGDMSGAAESYAKAVKMDPASKRNRQALARAYQSLGRTADAVLEEETLILQRETTARFRLAAAWNDIDRTAYKAVHADLAQATAIDPDDTRVAAYLATLATAEKKPQGAVEYYAMALALEQAHLSMKGRSLAADGKGTLQADDVGMTLLMNLRAAARYAALKQAAKRLAAEQCNLALEQRVPHEAMMIAPDRALLPNVADPKALELRTVQNLFAWSHVVAGHILLDQGKVVDAYKLFDAVAGWQRTRDIYEPQGLATGGKLRLYWASHDNDPAWKTTWLKNARLTQVLTSDEADRIMSILESQTQLARTGYADQHETMRLSGELMDLLYFKDAQPVTPGAYDPRNNPNYRGNNDNGPEDRANGGSGSGGYNPGNNPDAAR